MTDKQFHFCWDDASKYPDQDSFVSAISDSSIFQDDVYADMPAQNIVEQLNAIWNVSNMSMRDIRKASGLTQAAFSDRFCVPIRTVEDWDAGKRNPPDYVKIMIARQIGLFADAVHDPTDPNLGFYDCVGILKKILADTPDNDSLMFWDDDANKMMVVTSINQCKCILDIHLSDAE